jgi:hypothetical protein
MPTEEFGHRFHETPAYHGSITIDPASGSIRRIVIETDLKVDDPLRRADTAIQYGPVTLGNKRTICPISSLAYFQRRVDNNEHLDNPNVLNTTPVRVLNEVTFTNYQRLASTVRILPDAADGPPVVGTPPVNAPR